MTHPFLSGFESLSLCQRAGVYVLLSQGEVVYVGQGQNVLARIGHHSNFFDFDQCSWLPIEKKVRRLAVERVLIRAIRPAFNGQVSAPRDGDRAILVEFGIDEFASRYHEHVTPRRLPRVDAETREFRTAARLRSAQRNRARRLWAAVDRMFATRAAA